MRSWCQFKHLIEMPSSKKIGYNYVYFINTFNPINVFGRNFMTIP